MELPDDLNAPSPVPWYMSKSRKRCRVLDLRSSRIPFLLFDAVRMKPTHHFRSILDLLHFFFGYKNHSKMKKSVSINGSIYDDNTTDGTISKNAITINDRVIENAVLMEIQQALISLKQDYWQ